MAVLLAVLEWIVWGGGCLLAAFLLFRVVLNENPVIRNAEIVMLVGTVLLLIATVVSDFSKLHLLWTVPVVVYLGREVAGYIWRNRLHHEIEKTLELDEESETDS